MILYSEPLHLKCMKWIKSTLCFVILKLIYSFTVLNYGLKRLASLAVLRMPKSLMGSISAKITFWRHFTTPEKKRLNRGAVLCSADSASQDPTTQLPDSAFTDLNSLPPLLSPKTNLHVQAPSWTYGKLPVSSCSIQTPLFFVNLCYPTNTEMATLCNCIFP